MLIFVPTKAVSWPSGSRRAEVECSLSEARDGGANLVGALRPDKSRFHPMGRDELQNRRLQLDDAGMDVTAQALFVSSANQRSTRFSPDPLVGVKCT